MDYIETFKNLKTNNKYGRKSPHKAILMLAIIELYEQNILTDNEIFYDDSLKSMFLKVWNEVLPNEPLFHPEAYFPFWHLQSDSFWHIVPKRGHEDILSLMRDTNVKPSEAKVTSSVKCAELDEDLYFLLTLPSGRSSLKRVLLENYTNLSEEKIDILSKRIDNSVDNSVSALSDFEKILSSEKKEIKSGLKDVEEKVLNQFHELNEDVQIAINIDYFSFLKKHRNERELFKEQFPTVYDLFDKIVYHPIAQGDISPSFVFIFDNFLSDLKISLMSEDGSMEIISKIEEAIDILRGNKGNEDKPGYKNEFVCQNDNQDSDLISVNKVDNLNGTVVDDIEIEHVYLDSKGKVLESSSDNISSNNSTKEDRKGKPWTENEEELLTLYYKQGIDFSTIGEKMGRTEVSIKLRLSKLGLIDYVYGQDDNTTSLTKNIDKEFPDNFSVDNNSTGCSILNKFGDRVFSTDGKFKILNEKIYRLNLKEECFTVKEMKFDGTIWMKAGKKIVAYPGSELYDVIEQSHDYYEIIENIKDVGTFVENKIKVDGKWYNYNGSLIEPIHNKDENKGDDAYSKFSVKLNDMIRLFPSQLIGNVINLKLDRWGNRIIVVKTIDGSIKELIDSKYFYEKINKDNATQSEKKHVRKKTELNKRKELFQLNDLNDTITTPPKGKLDIGNWIQWKPTGTVGKVVGFRQVGSAQKIMIQTKDGRQIEVFDNPKAYDIILK